MSPAPLAIALRNAALHALARLVISLASRLPAAAAYRLGASLASLAWALQPRWRRTARRNLELLWHGAAASPARDSRWRARTARQAALHLGWEVIEFIRMGRGPLAAGLALVVEAEGVDELRRLLTSAQAQDRGVILIGLHLGNWELCGAYLASRVGPTYAVGKEQRDPFFTDLAFPWRERYGIRTIMAGNKANSAILRALREGAMLGLIADQNGGRRGVFAPLGAGPDPLLASTAPGAAVLALRTGSPVMLAYTVRLAPGRLKFIAGPRINLEGLPGPGQPAGKYSDDDLVEALTRINAAIAAVVAAYPEQWLLGHKRWKTRPPGAAALY